jgi:hypothetical protein
VAAKFALPRVPKLMEIIAAIPEAHRRVRCLCLVEWWAEQWTV